MVIVRYFSEFSKLQFSREGWRWAAPEVAGNIYWLDFADATFVYLGKA
jgi:hypothetical protein